MHVVVVGCGRAGSGLAGHLRELGHSVAIIDRSSAAFRRLPDDFTGQRIVGIGFDRGVLEEAGIERAGALAAVTNGDNSNIVIARIARESFAVEHVVARIYDPQRAEIYQRLGVPTVATSQWTVDQVLRWVLPSERRVEWTDPTAHVAIVEQLVPPDVAGATLSQLHLADLAHTVAYTRLGVTRRVHDELVLQEGDVLYLAVDTEHLDDVSAHFASVAEAT